jgi:hypothetical protein
MATLLTAGCIQTAKQAHALPSAPCEQNHPHARSWESFGPFRWDTQLLHPANARPCPVSSHQPYPRRRDSGH